MSKSRDDAMSHSLRRFVLKVLATKDQPVSATELLQAALKLPEHTGLSAGTLSYHTGVLIDAGMIRRAGPRKGGVSTFRLTDKGREIA